MNAKSRAKKFHLEFDSSPVDILIPEYCPILGIKLEVADGKQGPSSPSLDRIDSLRGYVRGNIRVISWRANKLKSDATPDELHAFAQFYYKTNLTELDF